ncbi:leucyl-tRNA synthetase [Parabacteroides sp. PF5-5]|uniref:leucine--tRNA ligase n=1 Tax=unclassified Parabacteroides TaxID=2649774 RepID=UPI0024741BF6|nr:MULTISPECIES: leucine--tRNA ligase [unclassified Parabacteroides]MDH6305968.1 leucyl-tRNA synthetase [Parabacteroides sp. PH5-39]MDH6317224.1 leucyl-tRNA synthetase [Parabacteroides sp. PF5-13]MDH6320680.1 leucyl-tRNA synthetase [Parabacteroides sp. PH5-13]MDH6324399.1 leucyl-tRNA synthetase [Parabacteroides sp. PH5-8]MDH6328409.1 leucyl-tRNA synthetase [Parabacteroides sp. PH5-41]
MEYNFREIEKKWQEYWNAHKVYKVSEDESKPKYYVLDMFPYPSGAGLHVGHPLGYIASDIYSRYKRLCGFNVLHPMGYDAYGLPAEQYAIQTGQHPYVTTNKNIERYREQLDKIGFSFDWNREIRTCDPEYYHWTQWAFIKMFNSYYCYDEQQARPIEELIQAFEQVGAAPMNVACSEEYTFTADEWNAKSEVEKQQILMNYRIAYLGDTMVNWCPALGTVLANDEVINGLSERGGYPVEQKMMRQWCLRVSAYAQRLLDGLNTIDWTDSLKETQRNWIGRSEGAEMIFKVKDSPVEFTIFTTRADTIFGVTFMVLAPESELVDALTTSEQREEVNKYLETTKKKTERERISDKKVTGVFSGSYAINPLTQEAIPVWISDYVLAGYGTGAIMAVPGHDSRDYAFAKHFNLPIIPLIEGCDISEESFDAKEGIMMNSPQKGKEITGGLVLNGLEVAEAIAKTKVYIEEKGLGKIKTNYRLRDATFSRQRYWGEPFPIYYDANGLPQPIPMDKLPLQLPDVDKFLPTKTGEPPLGRADKWAWDSVKGEVVETSKIDNKTIFPLELNTMPGFAGSSAYYLRYEDPHNNKGLVDAKVNAYWRNVDLYLGGTEHATGHLIYSRFWNKFLYDLGVIKDQEPFQKLINQGMIQGRSNFVYRINGTNTFVSLNLKDQYEVTPLHVDVNIVSNDILDTEAFRNWNPEYKTAEFILEDGKYICGWAVEKMSKSMYNVVNPDVIVDKFGADTLRLYEMFLGPLEQSKPWDTNGIDGVHRFLRKLLALFYGNTEILQVTNDAASANELKALHKLIKKVSFDIEHFSFNTSVSAFMICVNDLTSLKCNKRDILESLLIVLSPFAPHLTEELWHVLGNTETIVNAQWPIYNEEYLKEDMVTYAVSFNGKTRFSIELPAEMPREDVEKAALTDENAAKWLDGKTPKKIIVVPQKIVNIVI